MSKPLVYVLIATLLLLTAETSFIVGALIGIETRDDYVENKCLYKSRLELTKGRVMACWYLEGVTIK